MKTDSWLDENQSARSPGLTRAGRLVVAAAIAAGAGLVGFSGLGQCEGAEASLSGVRVVRASVTWHEGGRELSVVHVPEPVREAAPRVVVIERGERRDRQRVAGREIRAGIAAVTMFVRLLASGKMDG